MVKHLPADAEDSGHGFDPCTGKTPWTGKMATHSSEQRSLAGYSPWDRKSWTGLSD